MSRHRAHVVRARGAGQVERLQRDALIALGPKRLGVMVQAFAVEPPVGLDGADDMPALSPTELIGDFDVVLLRDPEGQAKAPDYARSEEELLHFFPELRGQYSLAETVPRYGERDTNLYVFLPVHR